ncbi:MAG TPA: DUF2226 domain-containing protein [Candidatus Norongarragalinales archaeon]|nr:DUF2226 domain-containing protein [Candidatus Norongarragalinales archaeon]
MVSLPSGKMLSKNADAGSIDFLKALVQLQKKNFSGYVALCIKGAGGFEEGTVLLDSGKIVGCAYEYFRHGKELQGAQAFQRVLNAAAAAIGTMDVVELTPEQVELVLAVNEKMIYVPDQKQLEGVSVKEFSPLFEREVVSQQPQEQNESREDLLKKYKMGGLSTQ